MTTSVAARRRLGPGGLLNTRHHKTALMIHSVIVLGHWVEHVAQAYQVYVLHWPRAARSGWCSRGS